MNRAVVLGALLASVFGGVGCGSDDGPAATTSSSRTPTTVVADSTSASTTSSVAVTSTTVATGPLDAATGELPPTPIFGTFGDTMQSGGAVFDESEFGLARGSITAQWYRVGDRWAVHYDGLDPEHASGTCLGTGAGDFAAHTPYGALACNVHPGNVLIPGSLHLCRGVDVIFTSLMPITATSLTATIERGFDDNSIVGIVSEVTVAAETDTAAAPEIDVTNCQVIS